MTFKTDARIRETSTTTGTGTYTLAGTPAGFQSFAEIGANNTCPYFATDGTNWEEGIGTVLTGPNRLERTHVLASSNADAAVNWGVGTRTLRCGPIGAFGVPRSASVSVAGGAGTQILTQTQQRVAVLILTGALTGNRNIEVDNTVWEWLVFNNTSGAFSLTLRVTGQSGIIITQGQRIAAYCDGTDVRRVAGIERTQVATTSGSSVDITGVPGWVTRITTVWQSVSSSSTGALLMQLGDAGGIETSGYVSGVHSVHGSGATTSTHSADFVLTDGSIATDAFYGIVELLLQDAATNTWVLRGQLQSQANFRTNLSTGTKSLSQLLTTIRVSLASGTFDGGSIAVVYE